MSARSSAPNTCLITPTLIPLTNAAYRRAIQRNCHEVAIALLNRRLLVVLDDFNRDPGIYSLTFKLIYWALYNDMVAHCIKVLDRHPKSATFWTIWAHDEKAINSLPSFRPSILPTLKNMALRLKTIREKTLFHIDSAYVEDPQRAWGEAQIIGNELRDVLELLWALLNELHIKIFNQPHIASRSVKTFDRKEAMKILEFLAKEGLL